MSRAWLSLLVLLEVAGALIAAPPVVKFPESEVKAELNTFVVIKAEVTNGKGATKYITPKSGLSVLPPALLNDPSALVFIPNREGVFEIGGYAGNEDGASDVAYTRVVVGKGAVEPPPVKPDDPKDPPVTNGGKFYFIIVRADGPVMDEKVKASARLGAWEEVRKDGHQMTDKTRSEIGGILKQSVEEDAAKYKARLDSYVNKLIVLRVSVDGKSSSFVGEKPIPTTDQQVKELVK